MDARHRSWCVGALLACMLLPAPAAAADTVTDPESDPPVKVTEGPVIAAEAAPVPVEAEPAAPVPARRPPPAATAAVAEAPEPASKTKTKARHEARPRLGARLRDLQGYLARVRRRLVSGGEPPPRTLRRLRRSLQEVTPVVEQAEALSRPRVRKRLRRARATARPVIVLIRRSELDGPEVRRVLAWLHRFCGPVAVMVPRPIPARPERIVAAA
jgi:hypothetical protein